MFVIYLPKQTTKNHNQEVRCLVAVGKTTHTGHHTQDVVVGGIDTHAAGRGRADRVVGHRQQQSGVINAGQVARAAGLVLLRGQREAVDVDTRGRHVGVVLVGLHLVEIAALTNREPVVAVELDQSRHHGVLARHALNTGHGVARLQGTAVPPVRVVERLLALPGVDHLVIAADERITLDNPDQLLTGVVEVQLQLVRAGVDALRTRILQNIDQILVADLGELATLIRVQVDVVHIQRGRHQVGRIHTVTDDVHVARAGLGSIVPAEVLQVVELQVDTHLVILEGDQRQGQTRVAAEPELQRDIQSILGCAAQDLTRAVRLTTRALVVAVLTTLHDHVRQLGHVANHLGVAGLLARLLGELVPDVEPVTVVLVDTLATDLELNVVDQVVANPVEPAELGTRAVRGLELDAGQSGLQIHAVDQVTVALDRARHLVTEARVAVERVLDGLHREVGVATVDRLEESDLGIAREVHILRAISH